MERFCGFKHTIFSILFICSLCYLLPIVIAHAEVDDEDPFTYTEGTGKGPKEWGHLKPGWKRCENGKLQSPIDLLSGQVQVLHTQGNLKVDYKPGPAVVKNRGHDVEVLWTGEAGKININGTDYKLVQCHWHSPSEHTFNGTRYELELHMVHQRAPEEYAVISILFKYGRPDPFLTRFFQQIKTIGDGEVKNLGIVDPRNIKFDTTKYYRYVGSLTTPPCTEGVVWTVINEWGTVSSEQVRALRDAVHDGFQANARPTQPLDARPVLFCSP